MWSRKELKDRAKAFLKRNYWKAFLVSIVIAIAGGNRSWSGGGSSNSGGHSTFNSNHSFDLTLVLIAIFTFIVIILIIMALRIFIGYSLEVGGRRYFVQSVQYKNNQKCFRFGFDGQNYGEIIKTMLLTDFYIFLWTLLLIIPGIVKGYSYSMVPYILADNPNIGVKKAIALSNEMTMGHKFDMFILDLSFIGWYLLGAIALGIGVLFVLPYDNATKAELYLVLRDNALQSNLCSYEDLLLTRPNFEDNNYL
jgi:Predicted integral membrane protein